MVPGYRLPGPPPTTNTLGRRRSAQKRILPASQPPDHRLSASQVTAIREVMRLFVDDDLANGLSLDKRLYCDACERVRPAAGFIQYDRYSVCNACAIEYEVAYARGLTASAGQYVRDKHFGEAEHYLVDALSTD